MSSVQFLLASALALLLFLAIANLVVVQYGRGVLRSAVEQGARSGSVSRSILACEDKAHEVVDQLLGGRMSDDLEIGCLVSGGMMVASGTATFESWTPMTRDFVVDLEGRAALEVPP